MTATPTTTDTEATVAPMPEAVVRPTQVAEDGSSVQAGYTEADPTGPSNGQEAGKPTLLAGKYTSTEELENAYKELEAKLGAASSGKDADSQDAADSDNSTKAALVETTDEAAALLQEKGLDISTFTREFEQTGALSEDSLSTLEAKGITRDMVSAYIQGNRALADAQINDIKNSVGGAEAYTALSTWAMSNLSQEEQQAYQDILNTNNPAVIKIAAQGLKARYDGAMGKDPSTIIGGNVSGNSDTIGSYASRAEMTDAIQDPRYAKDPAYRARVERKILNSNL